MLDRVNKESLSGAKGDPAIRHRGDCRQLHSDAPTEDLADGILTLADWSRQCIESGKYSQADAALRAIWKYADAIKRRCE